MADIGVESEGDCINFIRLCLRSITSVPQQADCVIFGPLWWLFKLGEDNEHTAQLESYNPDTDMNEREISQQLGSNRPGKALRSSSSRSRIGWHTTPAAGVSTGGGCRASGGISASTGAYRWAPSNTRVADILGFIIGDEGYHGGGACLEELEGSANVVKAASVA